MIRTGRLLDMSLSERIFFERASRRRRKSNYQSDSPMSFEQEADTMKINAG